MTWKNFFTSSIGKKFLVALTGLFLILFLIVHASINACIFLNDNGDTFNAVAHFMSHNWILRFLEIGLFAALILHAIQGLMVWKQNVAARPIDYYVKKQNRNSTWYSRSMGIMGTLILLFLVMHISHFFVGTKIALYAEHDAPHDLYLEMKVVFSKGIWVALYMVGLIALFWHLFHGFQSAFHSLGLDHKRYTSLLRAAGTGYSIIIIILFALMPLSFYFGWIH